MPIIPCLSKVTQEPPRVANSSFVIKKQVDKDQAVKQKEVIVFIDCGVRRRHLKRVEQSTLNCKNSSLFYLFYYMQMKKEDIARGLGINTQKAESASHVGNKVLPITDTAQTSSANNNEQCPNADKKEKTKGDKSKTISRMKELLKWAAAAKAEKGGKYIGRKMLHFRNRAALKAIPDDDQLTNESPKISFRWDVESCSTTSSVCSAISSSLKHERVLSQDSMNSTPLHVRDEYVARTGNWITTDSEFVVLEL